MSHGFIVALRVILLFVISSMLYLKFGGYLSHKPVFWSAFFTILFGLLAATFLQKSQAYIVFLIAGLVLLTTLALGVLVVAWGDILSGESHLMSTKVDHSVFRESEPVAFYFSVLQKVVGSVLLLGAVLKLWLNRKKV